MDEKSVKSILRSLLTSSPYAMTVQQLQKDFHSMVGTSLPYSNFGCKSVEQFLKSITDTCEVKGTGQMAIVKPIITEKVAHINLMVTKQKSKPPKSCRTYKRSYQAPRVDRSSSNYSSSSVTSLDTVKYPSRTEVKYPPQPQTQTQIQIKSSPQKTQVKNLPQTRVQNLPQSDTKHSKPGLNNCYYENTETVSKNIESEDVGVQTECSEKLKNKKSERVCAPHDDEDLSNVPERVQNNLKTLIQHFPEGIWCTELPKQYRQMFKKELYYLDYGYRSLIDMCVMLKDIFHYVRPGKSDFKLYDRSRPLPKSVEKVFSMASFSVDESMKVGDAASALPCLDWSDFESHIPSDVLPLGSTIPRQFMPENIKTNDVLEVIVVEVYDPSKFWICIKDTALDDLMDEMQDFYRQPQNVERYKIPEPLIMRLLYCVQMIFNEYHRALIVDTLPEDPEYVRVIYIDYGTVCKAPVAGMCFLHERFSQLPAQAIRCRLANISPPYQLCPWSRNAIKRFRQMLSKTETKIRICHIDTENLYVSVFLADVTNAKDGKILYINEELVKEGLAIWVNKNQEVLPVLPNYHTNVKGIHLFPSFFELEYGYAPSIGETFALQNANLPINFCYPLYFSLKYPRDNSEVMRVAEENYVMMLKSYRLQKFHLIFDVDVMKNPDCDIDFEYFGEAQEELHEFYLEFEKHDTVAEVYEEEDVPESAEDNNEIENVANKYNDLNTKENMILKRLQEDCKITEDILKEFDKYVTLDDVSSLDQTVVDAESPEELLNSACERTENSEGSKSGQEEDLNQKTVQAVVKAEEDNKEEELPPEVREESGDPFEDFPYLDLKHAMFDMDRHQTDLDDLDFETRGPSHHILADITFSSSSSCSDQEPEMCNEEIISPNGKTQFIRNVLEKIKHEVEESASHEEDAEKLLELSVILEENEATSDETKVSEESTKIDSQEQIREVLSKLKSNNPFRVYLEEIISNSSDSEVSCSRDSGSKSSEVNSKTFNTTPSTVGANMPNYLPQAAQYYSPSYQTNQQVMFAPNQVPNIRQQYPQWSNTYYPPEPQYYLPQQVFHHPQPQHMNNNNYPQNATQLPARHPPGFSPIPAFRAEPPKSQPQQYSMDYMQQQQYWQNQYQFYPRPMNYQQQMYGSQPSGWNYTMYPQNYYQNGRKGGG